MTFFSNTIYSHCDNAISAVQEQLTAVKSILIKHETEQHRLATEKLSLEDIVSNLRLEKGRLEKQVADLKVTLNDLCNDVAETEEQRQQVLTQVYTTGAASCELSYAISGDVDDNNNTVTSQISRDDSFDGVAEDAHAGPISDDFEKPIAANSNHVAHQNENNNNGCKYINDAIINNQQSQTHGDYPMMTQPEVIEEDVEDDSGGQTETEMHDENEGGFEAQEAQEMSFFMDTAGAVSEGCSPTKTTPIRKRRVSKVYKSPKKWRRMMRTHRLKSIFFADWYLKSGSRRCSKH